MKYLANFAIKGLIHCMSKIQSSTKRVTCLRRSQVSSKRSSQPSTNFSLAMFSWSTALNIASWSSMARTVASMLLENPSKWSLVDPLDQDGASPQSSAELEVSVLDGGWGGGWEDEPDRSHSSDGPPPSPPEVEYERRREVDRTDRAGGMRWRDWRRDRIAYILGFWCNCAVSWGRKGFSLLFLSGN